MNPETVGTSSARLARPVERERSRRRDDGLVNGRPRHCAGRPGQWRQGGTNTFAMCAIAAMVAGALGVQRPCFAGESEMTPKASGISGALGGIAIPDGELDRQTARGFPIFPLSGVLANAVTGGNAFNAPIVTGAVTTTGSLSGNVGSTTGFQNSGLNSLIQQTTVVGITP